MIKIYLNAGHGGKDSGAINSHTTEKAINLKVLLHLKKMLEENGNFDVKCSRVSDLYLTLNDRVKQANDWKADLYLSIHHNAGGGDGFDIIHSIHAIKGKELAQKIAEEFKVIGQNPHGVGVFSKESNVNPNTDYYFEIKNTNMIAVISEFAFMDSKDFTIIDTEEEMRAEAKALYNAILKFYNIPDVGKIVEPTEYRALKATFPVIVNSNIYKSDKPVVVIDGSTYMSLKDLCNALGIKAEWNEELKRVEILG